MDPLSALIGFIVGVVATAFAVELGLKKLFKPPAATKLTATWRLEEVGSALVASVDAADTVFPKGSKIVTAGRANPDAYVGREHRQHPSARGNFMVHPEKDRGLLFLGPIATGTMALSTSDPLLCARLRTEHGRLWNRGNEYVEELPLAEAVRRQNVRVRTRGVVQDVIAYKERHLMRLVDGQHVAGVLIDTPLDLVGATVTVTGRASKGTSGYTLIEATEVRRIEAPPAGRRPQAPTEVPVIAPEEPRPTPTVQPAREAPAPKPKPEPGVLRIPRAFQDAPKAEAPPAEPEPAPEPRRSLAEANRVTGRVVLKR